MDTSAPPSPERISPLPGFLQPIPPRADPTLPGETAGDALPDPASPNTATDPSQNPSPYPGSGPRGSTRTATSSAGKANPEAAAALVIGLGGLAVGVLAWAVRARLRRQLRRPTKEQMEDFAEPVGQFLYRRFGPLLAKLGPDLVDMILAGTAVGNYLNDGPVLEYDTPDAGLPADLNHRPDEEYI